MNITDADRATIERIASMPTPSETHASRQALLAVFGPLVAGIQPLDGVDPNYLTIDISITRGIGRGGEPVEKAYRVRFGIYKRADLNRPSEHAGPWSMLEVDGQSLLTLHAEPKAT